MPKQRTQESTQKRFRQLFIIVAIPLLSMCITFLLLYVLMPFRSVSPSLPKIVAGTPQNLLGSSKILAGPPVRLQIPTISIDTTINPVGLTSTGAMDIGENPDQVAWYQFGVIPGQTGSAVIAGHYGWQTNGHGSIFNNLNILKLGDIVSVYDSRGIETDFVVRESRLYDPTSDANAVFNSDDGAAHLNLITCQGSWVNAKDSYSKRLVIFTDLKQNK